jgi:hypothetical protein
VRSPVIADTDIAQLLAVPKMVADIEWRSALLPPSNDGHVRSSRLDLGEVPAEIPLRGYLHVYAREGLHRASEDWSTGLVYTDYAGHSYRVIRCNSAHLEDHVNRIERTVIVRHTHVHTLTERYQRHRRASGDGFAEPTSAFSNLPEAIDHLAMLSNLQPAGRLFL